MDTDGGRSSAAVATLPLLLGGKRSQPVGRPLRCPARKLPRLLLGGDVRCIPQGSARLRNAHTDRLPLLLLGIPLRALLAYGHRLYHLGRYRAEYGTATTSSL
jgi:hypothetical protein